MSNIANTVQFLKGNPLRYITIIKQDTGKSIGKDAIYLEDIPQENLEAYIKLNLGDITKPTLVWVEMRTKNGTSSKKENHCKIEVSPSNYVAPMESRSQKTEPTPEAYSGPSFLGNPGSGNMFGLGFPEIMNMQRKADQLEEKKEQLLEAKEDFKNLKQKHDLLEVDHRGVLTKLSIAESQKEMAVMLAKAENKSFADSPAFSTLMEQAPAILAAIAAKSAGSNGGTSGMLGNPDLSASKKEFIEHVIENVNDNQVNFLGSVCHYIDNESFINKLKVLIQQQNAAV